MGRFRVAAVPGLPRFYGGLVGYFGYDTVRYVEKRLAYSTPPDSLGTPDILLMVSNDVIVFDNLKGIMQIITLADPETPDALIRAKEHLSGIHSWPQSRRSASTSSPATSCRWFSRNACPCRSAPPRSTFIARCAI
jgi:anthranilate synthase component I